MLDSHVRFFYPIFFCVGCSIGQYGRWIEKAKSNCRIDMELRSVIFKSIFLLNSRCDLLWSFLNTFWWLNLKILCALKVKIHLNNHKKQFFSSDCHFHFAHALPFYLVAERLSIWIKKIKKITLFYFIFFCSSLPRSRRQSRVLLEWTWIPIKYWICWYI